VVGRSGGPGSTLAGLTQLPGRPADTVGPVEIPDGFTSMKLSSFSDSIGPIYVRETGALPVFGLRISEKHSNTMGQAHGGLLSALCDVTLGQGIKRVLDTGQRGVTASLHVTFLRAASIGDWLEVHPAVERVGRSLVHASCVLRCDDKVIARAAGTFAVQ